MSKTRLYLKLLYRYKFLTLCFLLTAILVNQYGSLAYATVVGKQDMYYIGESCVKSRADCERTHFPDEVRRIEEAENISDSEIAEMIIDEHQRGYAGNCPCPYNSDSRGNSCGGRSSYSRNGRIQYCYASDIAVSRLIAKKQDLLDDAQAHLENEISRHVGLYENKLPVIALFIYYFFHIRRLKKKILINLENDGGVDILDPSREERTINHMAKSVRVTSESDSGRNQRFHDTKSGKDMNRPEFVKEIKQGNFPDYHVRKINGLDTPVSNPDRSESNNLD